MRINKSFIQRIINDGLKEASFFGGLFFYIFLSAFVFALGKNILFLQLVAVFILTYSATLLIRFFYYKERPRKEKYTNFIERLDASSFPSLHSMRASAMFVVFHFYFNSLWISELFLSLAIAVFASRYFLKKHFLEDILVGAILGLGIAFLVAALLLAQMIGI
jgi:membrane-associated phospholipid phosphatase